VLPLFQSTEVLSNYESVYLKLDLIQTFRGEKKKRSAISVLKVGILALLIYSDVEVQEVLR